MCTNARLTFDSGRPDCPHPGRRADSGSKERIVWMTGKCCRCRIASVNAYWARHYGAFFQAMPSKVFDVRSSNLPFARFGRQARQSNGCSSSCQQEPAAGAPAAPRGEAYAWHVSPHMRPNVREVGTPHSAQRARPQIAGEGPRSSPGHGGRRDTRWRGAGPPPAAGAGFQCAVEGRRLPPSKAGAPRSW
jgi:hypothetical protein